MKAILNKLKSKAGESLVESLAAILVFTMASIVMYSLVTSAADINRTAKEMDAENQAHMIAVEKAEGAPSGTATIAIVLDDSSASGTTIATEPVDIYGGQGESLFTYFVHPRTAAGGGS